MRKLEVREGTIDTEMHRAFNYNEDDDHDDGHDEDSSSPHYLAKLAVSWLVNVPATYKCVSRGQAYLHNFTCCRTETEAADQTY